MSLFVEKNMIVENVQPAGSLSFKFQTDDSTCIVRLNMKRKLQLSLQASNLRSSLQPGLSHHVEFLVSKRVLNQLL